MADVFGRSNQVFAGAFPVDGARLAVAGYDGQMLGVGMLTQNLSFNYNQPITVLFEVGTNNAYLISGRARGSVNMSRVLGPRDVMKGFYTKYGNVCNAGTNIINIDAKSTVCQEGGGAQALVVGIQNCVITSLSGSIAAENSLFSEAISMQFLTLNYS